MKTPPNTGRAAPSADRKAFARMIDQAAALEPAECARHARVSRDNRHRCTDCFTCACLTVMELRAAAREDTPRASDPEPVIPPEILRRGGAI